MFLVNHDLLTCSFAGNKADLVARLASYFEAQAANAGGEAGTSEEKDE